MVSIGSKALPMGKHKTSNLREDGFLAGKDIPYGKKRSMHRKSIKKTGLAGDHSTENLSGGLPDKAVKTPKISKHQNAVMPEASFLRKQVDPETAKYYSEIANVIEGAEVDLEERSMICGNALEESRGKEVELATDYVLSHTFQTLLEGCDVNHLCNFLQSCAKDFPRIAMDRSGSHVAETALKSLVVHLQDVETHSLIEETVAIVCRVIVEDSVDMMCNCYSSHVLRSLLCFCKGVPLDSTQFHATKSSIVLAERLNFRQSQPDEHSSQCFQKAFPDLLRFLVSGMLNHAVRDISTLQVDQYGSLVLQAALKLLVGNEEVLFQIIPILLGCNVDNAVEGHFIETTSVQSLLSLMKETAYSHLMEVILEVAPATLYDELLTKVFQNSLFEMSSHHCGNFVVQALVSHARCGTHMELIWEELGPKFEDLLWMGKPGVVASLIAASQRLHVYEHKSCQALAAAVCSVNESPGGIVPRILFLESYFSCKDKSNWSWPSGVKMHVMGSLILQLVFQFPSEFIQPYISSITSMEADHVLEASKDSRGQRVIEGFLNSNSSSKQKRRLVMKLKGHFGELALNPSGSFTVEKCFNASNISLREAIVSELVAVESDLSKTKQGPLLSRKLDVDGYAKRPDQWKAKQSSKQSAYKEFYATFGLKETKSSKVDSFLADTPRTSQPETIKEMRKEIDASLASAAGPSSSMQFIANVNSTSKMEISGHKHHAERAKQHGETSMKHLMDDDASKRKNKRQKSKKHGIENVAMANEATDTVSPHQKTSHSADMKEKKRHRKDDSSKISRKKFKA